MREKAMLPGKLLAALASALLASCGGLENPDLTTGAVEGRIDSSFPGGRVYLFGNPEVAAPLAADGSFRLVLPVGTVVLVAFDGADRAGLLGALVRPGEVTRAGSVDDGPITPGTPAALSLPLAGFVAVTARSTAGDALSAARFTVVGTDQREVAPVTSSQALIGPLPPGTFDLMVRSAGFAELTEKVEVLAGQVVTREVTLVVSP